MQFLSKVFTALRNPKMAIAFARWISSRIFGGSPRVCFRKIDGQISAASIGGWISFSEYWTYQGLIPDSEEHLLLRSMSRQDGKAGLALDIGSNVGIFATRIASLGHQVHAFEPMPDTFARLEQNVTANDLGDLIRVKLLGVGDQEGFVDFERPRNSPGQSRISTSGGPSVIQVPITTLDRYAEEEGLAFIDFLKIDVEGMETRVIRGGRKMFLEKRVGVALIEICPWNLNHAGTSMTELFAEIESVSYRAYRLLPDGTPGEEPKNIDLSMIVLENFVLLPN